MAEIRGNQGAHSNAAPAEQLPDAMVEIDELVDADDSSIDDEKDNALLFARSTDVRRRIEEKLEVRLLRDELGIDDLDID